MARETINLILHSLTHNYWFLFLNLSQVCHLVFFLCDFPFNFAKVFKILHVVRLLRLNFEEQYFLLVLKLDDLNWVFKDFVV
jgi:hypothetical protein